MYYLVPGRRNLVSSLAVPRRTCAFSRLLTDLFQSLILLTILLLILLALVFCCKVGNQIKRDDSSSVSTKGFNRTSGDFYGPHAWPTNASAALM